MGARSTNNLHTHSLTLTHALPIVPNMAPSTAGSFRSTHRTDRLFGAVSNSGQTRFPARLNISTWENPKQTRRTLLFLLPSWDWPPRQLSFSRRPKAERHWLRVDIQDRLLAIKSVPSPVENTSILFYHFGGRLFFNPFKGNDNLTPSIDFVNP